MAELQLTPLPPKEAIAHFRAKISLESFDYRDLEAKMHARVFTVAKSAGFDVLQDIREAVDRAIADGRTFARFKDELVPTLQAKGWWGRREVVDPQTGESRVAQLGSTRRLRTIYDTNLRTAYAAGRWQRIQGAKDQFPFLQYLHTPQEHPRLQHLAWGDAPTILPIDDPWWDTHYPPNGYNCKCYTQQLNGRMMQARGLEPTDKPIRFPPKAWRNPRTGETSLVEEGVDPSFNSNPGKSPLEPLTPSPLTPPDDVGLEPPPKAPPRPPPPAEPALEREKPGADLLEENATPAEGQAALLGQLGIAPGQSGIFTDVAGGAVIAGPALFETADHRAVTFTAAQIRAMPLVGQTIREPAEIRWIWRSGPGGRQLLMRRYIASWSSGGRDIDVVVDQSSGGSSPAWTFTTSLDGELDLDSYRWGVVAWRRRAR